MTPIGGNERRVVPDACVLMPMPRCDTILRLAESGRDAKRLSGSCSHLRLSSANSAPRPTKVTSRTGRPGTGRIGAKGGCAL